MQIQNEIPILEPVSVPNFKDWYYKLYEIHTCQFLLLFTSVPDDRKSLKIITVLFCIIATSFFSICNRISELFSKTFVRSSNVLQQLQ